MFCTAKHFSKWHGCAFRVLWLRLAAGPICMCSIAVLEICDSKAAKPGSAGSMEAAANLVMSHPRAQRESLALFCFPASALNASRIQAGDYLWSCIYSLKALFVSDKREKFHSATRAIINCSLISVPFLL